MRPWVQILLKSKMFFSGGGGVNLQYCLNCNYHGTATIISSLKKFCCFKYSSHIETSALIKYDNVSTQDMWDCFTTQKTLKQHLPSALTLWNQKRKKLSQNFSGILHQLYQNNAYFNLYFESQVIHDMLKLTCY